MQKPTFSPIAIIAIVFLFNILSCSYLYAITNKSYGELWKRVDSLLKIQQPESALKTLDDIYQKSKEEKSQIQQIKAFVGRVQLKFESKDELVPNPFDVWEKELSGLNSENQSVLRSYQGEFMIQLFNRSWGELYRRTKGAVKPGDITTWDMAYFKSQIDSCFLKSIENHEVLSEISSKAYLELLDTVKLNWKYRPTLLDLVTTKAIEFYRNDRFELSPIPLTWVKDTTQFFENLNPETNDIGGFDSRIFNIFRLLENYHQKNGETDALFHLKLDRLSYIYEKSFVKAKDEMFFTALKTFEKQIGNHPFKAEILEKQAFVLTQLANKYFPSDPASAIYRLKNNEAANIYLAIIKQFPNSPVGIRCVNKLHQLLVPQLQLKVENFVRKGFPFAVSVGYQNLKSVKAKLYRVNHSEYLSVLKTDKYYSGYSNPNFRSSRLISDEQFQLKPDRDMRNHTTEFVFPKLNSGLYQIKLEGIAGKDTCSSTALFTVSGITFNESENKFKVLDIEEGSPLKGANFELFDLSFNDWNSVIYKSSANGEVKPVIKEAKKYIVQVVYKTDTVSMQWSLFRNSNTQNRANRSVYFFTDRSIYRPGQTVFFKGILFNGNGETVNSVENELVDVILKNANYQNIDTLKLTTNRYGSVMGQFRIPTSGLPGEFIIISKNDFARFRVEEYRRPGFKIIVDDLKGEFRINSLVEFTGKVATFSGVPLKNVTGKYRISRNLSWGWRSFGEPVQIAEGLFCTDSEGKYRFDFIAKPDNRYTEINSFQFGFKVELEVTDITGETQSIVKSLQIKKEALTASLKGDEVIDLSNTLKNRELKFSFKMINSDNQEIKSNGKIELIRLKCPKNLLRKRQWVAPDSPIYTQEQWNALSPGNQYGDEIKPINYEEDKVIQTNNFEKEDQTVSSFNISNLEQGYYKVRLIVKDQFGSQVKAEQLVRVVDSSKKVFPFPENSWVNLSKTTALPGESVNLLIGNFGRQFWNVQIYRNKGSAILFNGLIDNSFKKITIPVDSTDQGGFSIQLWSLNQGVALSQRFEINVPWIQKELKLSVEDFPKIVVPGKEVAWKVRVVDSKGKPAKAEIAGVLYDASLDKILPHNWQLKVWRNSHNVRYTGCPQTVSYGISKRYKSFWITEKKEVLPEFRKTIVPEHIVIRGLSARIATVNEIVEETAIMEEEPVVVGYGVNKKSLVPATFTDTKPIEIRKDFRETAWFNARFETDQSGRGEVSFKLPESVTEWKFMALAHTPQGLSGTMTDKFVTQKQLMVEPFPTRFLTVGDEVTFPVKVTNLSGKSLNLEVKTDLINVVTGRTLETASRLNKITIADGKSEAVNWKLQAPTEPGLYKFRVTAQGDGFSDGFESVLPVAPDRKWTTEPKAFTVKPGNNYTLNFNKLGSIDQINKGKWNLTLMTNSIGLILDALPQLIGSEVVTTLGVANRLTGALILRKTLTDFPEIAKELELQRIKLLNQPDSFKTKLEKGEQFTNQKLEETPWLQESIYEKEKIAKFNPDSVKTVISDAIQRLEVAQLPDGGFSWCPGMESSEWITVQILNNIAQFGQKNLLTNSETIRIRKLAAKSVKYLDNHIAEDFRRIKEKDRTDCQPSSYIYDYLMARSAFKDFEFAAGTKEPYNYFLDQASKNWNKTGAWQQVQLVFVLKREGDEKLLQTIVKSLEERAIKSDELGTYWKRPMSFFFYCEPDIVFQSFVIQLFSSINAPSEKIDALKLWLLQQKRTHAWDSPFSTAQAAFALLSNGNEPIANQTLPELYLDGKKLGLENSKTIDGFVQLALNQTDIKKDSKLELKNTGKNVVFGGLFHSYFKQVDDTTRFGSSLKIRKEIFKLERSVRGDSLVNNLSNSRPGDLLMVRLMVENDRDLGFISIDDQRPAGTEPIKQLSGYEYNGGLWYYRVNVDTGTRLYISNLPKGRFVIEYPVRVSHLGTFSGGRANIQCSFAPEFGANHSPGKISFELK